jgi:hypothetical protein
MENLFSVRPAGPASRAQRALIANRRTTFPQQPSIAGRGRRPNRPRLLNAAAGKGRPGYGRELFYPV